MFGGLLAVAMLTQLLACAPSHPSGLSAPTSSDAVQVLQAIRDQDAGLLAFYFGRKVPATEAASLRVRLLGRRTDASFGQVGFATDALEQRADGARVAHIETGIADSGVVLAPGVASESVSVVFVRHGANWFVSSVSASPQAGL